MGRLDLIINTATDLEREARLAKAGLFYAREDESGNLQLPAGTSAHVEATQDLLCKLAALAS